MPTLPDPPPPGAPLTLVRALAHQQTILAGWSAVAWERDVGCCQEHSDTPDTVLDAARVCADALTDAWLGRAEAHTPAPAGTEPYLALRRALTPEPGVVPDPGVLAWAVQVEAHVHLADVLGDFRAELTNGALRLSMPCHERDAHRTLLLLEGPVHVRALTPAEVSTLTAAPG